MLTVHFYSDTVILEDLIGCAKWKTLIEHIAFIDQQDIPQSVSF